MWTSRNLYMYTYYIILMYIISLCMGISMCVCDREVLFLSITPPKCKAMAFIHCYSLRCPLTLTYTLGWIEENITAAHN